jgi:hypothetical protein
MEIDAPPTETVAEPKSSRTSSRVSRVELITRGESRRRWSTEPTTNTGRVSLTPAQVSMLLEGIDWRMPPRVRRPELAG